jgi:CRP/FNR family transcriptional regulator
MAKRVRRHASLVKILSLHEVSQRLALFLLAEAKRAKRNAHGPITFRLELSNHQIAIRIGSVRDVVSRALAKFQEERLIANKRREITIIDLQALKRHANISQ